MASTDDAAVLADCLDNLERVVVEARRALLIRLTELEKAVGNQPAILAYVEELRREIIARLR